MMYSPDPIGSLMVELENYCDESQESKFESALADYELCTGASLSDFIETLLPASIGTAMTCAPYFYESIAEFAADYYAPDGGGFTELIFRKPMPDDCVVSLPETTPSGIF